MTDFSGIDYSGLPEGLRDSMKRYIEQRTPTGGFLRAVLENNLMAAVARADIYNRAQLCGICQWVFNYCPQSAWGSPAKVRAWLAKVGAEA